MPYTITHSDGDRTINVADQSLNTTTSLKFVGKNYNGYAKSIAENFLHVLENFASDTAPVSPTQGQLWYSTDSQSAIPRPQLMISADGTDTGWVPASNIFKDVAKPTRPAIGDLWVDIAKQQLYIYSGSSNTWLLVGPQYSSGSSTGPVADKVYDSSDNAHNIIKFMVGVILDDSIQPPLIDPQVAAIISFTSFTPKAAIPGFAKINMGLNISTSSAASKVWGTASQADALLVGTTTVPSTNFLRSDVASTTNFKLTVANAAGIAIGTNGTTELKNTTSGSSVLHNNNVNPEVIIRLADSTPGNQLGYKDAISITSNNITVNNPRITTTGGITANGTIIITDSTDSPSTNFGSIKTAGGIAVTKRLSVGGAVTIAGSTTTTAVAPSEHETYDLGAASKRWKDVHAKAVTADKFYGTFEGNVVGTFVGPATSLSNSTTFKLTGDVESAALLHNGDGSPVTFATTLTQDAFTSRGALDPDSLPLDQILINRPTVGLKRISKETFVSTIPVVPVGTVLPFAGTVLPPGYLFCDGSKTLISNYQKLYAVIGRTYSSDLSTAELATSFRVPDLRGRMALGRDTMTNGVAGSADRVVGADTRGSSGGNETAQLTVPGGTVTTTGTASVGVMNPFLAIDYIIYTGNI